MEIDSKYLERLAGLLIETWDTLYLLWLYLN